MCPNCNEPLISFEFNGVEVDHCPVCRGTWLDAGELESLIELAGVSPSALAAAVEESPELHKSKRRCPRCRGRLRLIELRSKQAHPEQVSENACVHLDRCPRGHGLWFDAEEMTASVRLFHDGGDAEAVTRFFAELFRNELDMESASGGGDTVESKASNRGSQA